VPGEQLAELLGRHRRAVEIALHVGAAELADAIDLLAGFDALGGGGRRGRRPPGRWRRIPSYRRGR
jgi:hypothetical protein